MRVRLLPFPMSVGVMLWVAVAPVAAQTRASTQPRPSAQAPPSTDGFGIKGGVTFSNLDLEVPSTIVTEKGQTGFTAGAFYGVRLAGPLHVDVEGLFTTKGAKYSFGDDLENRLTLT